MAVMVTRLISAFLRGQPNYRRRDGNIPELLNKSDHPATPGSYGFIPQAGRTLCYQDLGLVVMVLTSEMSQAQLQFNYGFSEI